MTLNSSSVDRIFDVSALVSAEDWAWHQRALDFGHHHLHPHIDNDFDAKHFRHEIVSQLGKSGFLGMHIAGYGCAGASATAYGLVCHALEQVDSGWRTLVSVQGSLAMGAIAHWGSEAQKEEWLPRMARGEVLGCFALTEPEGGSDPAAMTTFARRDGSDWVLNGTKRWIGLATLADVAILWAQTDDGVRGFIIPTDTPGFHAAEITNKLSMRASVQCEITLTDLRLPDSARLENALGLRGPFTCLTEARYGIAWGVMGAAKSCLDVAVERATSREVFGRPIGANQLIQAKLANMLVEYQKGMLLALHLGTLHDVNELTPAQVSIGKLNNVREAISIASQARSILGGDGITSDFPVMRHMANLESVRTYEGTDEIHTLILGRELTGIPAF
ncbi:acyl-CoA dehydrogenase family protein [Lysinibacter sp. HNR]|uniref:acyl-CoA dehydrogenase family protein n=1 Tax=Lysinibacter sp. HNR TaxID=3031408 RepID=UPI002435D54F|nr:acyl-CoA dehydrogenase family protein [Lysinibacter sp. HNR]WGD36951.1 acyl-CoA dehydrogenase family protein [Lysinibacter sp. HNR]